MEDSELQYIWDNKHVQAQEQIAEKLEYFNSVYPFIRRKGDVLIYGKQVAHLYSDWVEDGKVLVVKYYADRDPKHAYELMHVITIDVHSGRFDVEKPLGNRLLTPVK